MKFDKIILLAENKKTFLNKIDKTIINNNKQSTRFRTRPAQTKRPSTARQRTAAGWPGSSALQSVIVKQQQRLRWHDKNEGKKGESVIVKQQQRLRWHDKNEGKKGGHLTATKRRKVISTWVKTVAAADSSLFANCISCWHNYKRE